MLKVVIIGGGIEGEALIPILNKYKEVKIAGIIDVDNNAPGMKMARQMGIATSNNYRHMLSETGVDIIINIAGKDEITADLYKIKKTDTEIIGGLSAKLLSQLIGSVKKHEEEISKSLRQQKMLYNIGIMLTSSEREDEMMTTLVVSAMQLTGTPAGSIAQYSETETSIEIVSSIGFSKEFTENRKWAIKRSGLIEYIMNRGTPTIINNLDNEHLTDLYSDALRSEGIKSLIATPLIADRKTIGILFVEEFKYSNFTKKDESTLALLATQAATAIEKIQLLEKTKRMAITDELTSLYNHRHFVSLLKEEVIRAKRYQRPISLMLIDIDYFKNYNDTNGHIKGNEILKKTAKTMLGSIRNIDTLARFGGEEFSIILPETDLNQGVLCAERVRKAVEEEIFYGEEKQPNGKLTVSIGVAALLDDNNKQLDTLLYRADKALYRAKEKGRNIVVTHEE